MVCTYPPGTYSAACHSSRAVLREVELVLTWTAPIPGEIASGHEARLGRLNGITTRQHVYEALREQFRNVKNFLGNLPTIFYLALGSGGDCERYVREHAWMVERPPAQHLCEIVKHSDSVFMSRENRFGLGPSRQGVYSFCLRCVEEDLDVSGFSYWRRIHQFPGIDVCSRHKWGLSTIQCNESRLSLPSEHLREASPRNAELIATVVDHPVVSRYETIATALLRRNSPICVATANEVLEWRARELGLLPNRVSRQIDLRSHIFGLAPHIWLTTYFSKCSQHVVNPKTGRHRTTEPDWEPNSPMEYALAFAVLFDTAEEVLTHIADPEAT